MRSEAGDIQRLVGTVVDITAAKLAAAQLQLSNELLADAQRIAKSAASRLPYEATKPRAGRTSCIGCSAWTGAPPSIDLFVSRLHPDDRERIQGLIAGSLATGKVAPSRARVLRADGSVRHVDMRADLHRGPQGEPLAIRGTVHDVTGSRRPGSAVPSEPKDGGDWPARGRPRARLQQLAHGHLRQRRDAAGGAEAAGAARSWSAASTATTVTNRLLAFTRQARGSPRAIDLTAKSKAPCSSCAAPWVTPCCRSHRSGR